MFKGYIINLNRQPERLYRFNQHPDAKYFERFPAIDRKQLELVGSPDLFFDTTKINTRLRRNITLGEVACTLSHISVWQRALLDDDIADSDFIIVAEDDVTLDAQFSAHVRHLNDFLKNTDFDLLMLQRLYMDDNPPIDRQNPQFSILTQNVKYDSAGASLYMMKKSRIKIICEWLKTHKPNWLADEFTAFCPIENLGLLYPLIGVVTSSDSDLEHDRYLARQAKQTLSANTTSP